MNAYSRRSTLAEYHSVATHGGVAAADPHRIKTRFVSPGEATADLLENFPSAGTGAKQSALGGRAAPN